MRVGPRDSGTGAFLAPIARATEAASEWSGRLGAAMGAVIQIIWKDFFVLAAAILLIAHAYDWHYGRTIAKVKGTFDEEKSRLGLHSKVSSFVIVFIVRLLEFSLTRVGLADTLGLFAAGITVLLIVQDLRSIEKKRISTGHGPIPFLSTAMDYIENTIGRAMPGEEGKNGPRT